MKTEIRLNEYTALLAIKYTLQHDAQTVGHWARIVVETPEGRVVLEGPPQVLADALRAAAKTANRLTPEQDYTDGHGG